MALHKSSLLIRVRSLYNSFTQTKTFLSEAYRCEDAWKQRLEHPLLQNLNPSDYFYELDKKYRLEGKISAIDADLFINRIDDSSASSLVDEVVDITKRLRRSKETVKTLPSTLHGIIRGLLLVPDSTQLILKVLTAPIQYGVFLDNYTANLLMDTLIQSKDYSSAARVASTQMLQEDFGPPLTQALTLASSYMYASTEKNFEWQDLNPPPEEPKEEVKVRVKYLRNPYFDDHFDLRKASHLVGKTLAFCSPLVDGSIGISCEILGWALYEKWTDLANALERAMEGTTQVAASVISQIKDLLINCQDSDAHSRVELLLVNLESGDKKSLVADLDLGQMIEKLVKEIAAKTEIPDIKAQEKLYEVWEKAREEEVEFQIKQYEKNRLLEEIEVKKRTLAEKEEVIFFFDNKDKLELLLPEKSKKFIPKKKSLIFGHKKPRVVDEGYIPPEVNKRTRKV